MSEQSSLETLTVEERMKREMFSLAVRDFHSIFDLVPRIEEDGPDADIEFEVDPKSIPAGILSDANRIEATNWTSGSLTISASWSGESNGWNMNMQNEQEFYLIFGQGEIGHVTIDEFAKLKGPKFELMCMIFAQINELKRYLQQGVAVIKVDVP